MSGTGVYGGREGGPAETQVPEQYRAIAELVSGYVDDKLGEFRATQADILERIIEGIGNDRATLARLHSNVSGLMAAVAELQESSGESMPEHVYKQFIRAEAERLRIVKKTVAPTPDPGTDT